jgi:hypothetical protein
METTKEAATTKKIIDWRQFIKALGLGAASLGLTPGTMPGCPGASPSPAAGRKGKPNIIVIMSDDIVRLLTVALEPEPQVC